MTKAGLRVFLLFAFLGGETIARCMSSQGNHPVNPDDPTGTIKSQLEGMVKTQIGQGYRGGFQVLDSIIAHHGSTTKGEDLSDPYGTLKGCILFCAVNADSLDYESGVMGIFKNGAILWHSDPIFKGDWGGTLSLQDINHDGKVEILVEWYPTSDITVRYLWIISWDGHSGRIINQVEPRQGNSMLISAIEMFHVIEPDTVQPALIRGYCPYTEGLADLFPDTAISTLPWITYSWNGSLYGLWPSTPQVSGDVFLPANRLTVGVHCLAKQIDPDTLSFQYTWQSDPRSKQAMAFFALNGVSHSFASSEPKNWRYIGYWRDQPIAAWEVEGLDGYGGSLKSGDTLKGVRLKAKGVPGIVRFYAQGFQPPPAFGLNNPAYKSAYEQNVFNNSYSNLTLGPVDPPIQLGPVTFVDTLKNYLSRSRTLGWFTNRPDTAKPLAGELATDSIMTRLTKRLTRVRNALVANDSATARTELTRFINKVQSLYKETNDGDQAPGEIVLTSEAYALLKFNAQFLLAKIAQ